MDKEFIDLVNQLVTLKKEMFNSIKNNVDYIIINNIRDKQYIENTLDNLFECCYDDESISYYNKLCQYYELVDKEGSKFYRKEFDKYFE